jgi:hypothetical protein
MVQQVACQVQQVAVHPCRGTDAHCCGYRFTFCPTVRSACCCCHLQP